MAAAQQDIHAAHFGLEDFSDFSDGMPVLDEDDEEELANSYPSVAVILGSSHDLGTGTLFITTRRVIWQGDAGSRRGLYADFQNINMHAISNDQSAARKPCIYMQLEPSTSAFADTAEGEADDDEDITPEVRLVPEDSSKLEELFQTLCDCAALNPDPQDADAEEDAEFYYNEEEVRAGARGEERTAMLDHFDSLLQAPHSADMEEPAEGDPDRFEDAEETEHAESHADGLPHSMRPEQ
ncbi:g9905 [Coccomyxa viridis]|uniref:G9905 protein n=1 Tax=Coccomyxa viridis TaxID=1274662 RepID=A0ABP1G4G7_9CHLO